MFERDTSEQLSISVTAESPLSEIAIQPENLQIFVEQKKEINNSLKFKILKTKKESKIKFSFLKYFE
jgi:hypothetical protein